MLNTPARLSLAADIFLKEARCQRMQIPSQTNNRKNSSCFDNLQLFNANCQSSKEFNCTRPTIHGVKSELSDDELGETKKKI